MTDIIERLRARSNDLTAQSAAKEIETCRRYNAKLISALGPNDQSCWQPIETAPKHKPKDKNDILWILGIDETEQQRVMTWDFYPTGGGNWYYAEYYGDEILKPEDDKYRIIFFPTRWISLPTPPNREGE